MKIQLRDYQEECLKKIKWSLSYFTEGNDLISLPTGSGKSVVIAEMANYLNQNILILQPSVEILNQNKNKLLQYVDEEEIGVYSASLKEKIIKKYTFATIGSIYKLAEDFKHFKVVIIDEAHTVNPKEEGSMYMTFLNEIPGVRVFGFTATPYRLFKSYFKEGNGLFLANATKILTRIKPKFWERILFNVDNIDLVNKGYICPIEYIDKTLIDQDEIPVNKSQTDFDIVKYEKILSKEDKEKKVLQTINEVDHKHILVFCSSISQAQRLSEQVKGSEYISSEEKFEKRQQVINDFKEGKCRVVFNVGVLTTGFDMPELDCIMLIRPTKSISLYYQMLGRGVRKAPGKEKCFVYDFSNTVKKLGRIETIKIVKNGLVELVTETGSWHNKRLYAYKVKDIKPKEEKTEENGIMF